MAAPEIQFNDWVEDIVTGATGKVTGLSQFVDGGGEARVVLKELNNGVSQTTWIPISRLKITAAAKVGRVGFEDNDKRKERIDE